MLIIFGLPIVYRVSADAVMTLSDWINTYEMTFFFLGEGDTGRSQGIEGGLGVFASFRADSVRPLIKL